MAYTTINKSTDYFNTKLYTGNGGTNAITGVGFEPSLTWIKSRTTSGYQNIFDAVRGSTKRIFTNVDEAEQTVSNSLTAFDSDGFTVGSNGDVNGNSQSQVAWNWKANGAGSSNTDGNVTTTVSANTTAGFSIVSYTGTGSASSTMGHGLGSTPAMIMIKRLNTTGDWRVWHQNLSATTGKSLKLNTTEAEDSNNSFFYSSAPNANTFNAGSGGNTNASGGTYIAYCFRDVVGYSKFGTYTGNVTTDNSFIYTGFKVSFWMVKNIDDPTNWMMFDNKRRPFNETQGYPINANETNAEDGGSTGYNYDFLSNGIKLRASNNNFSKDNDYIYMAFGQSLVGSNNTPCTAR